MWERFKKISRGIGKGGSAGTAGPGPSPHLVTLADVLLPSSITYRIISMPVTTTQYRRHAAAIVKHRHKVFGVNNDGVEDDDGMQDLVAETMTLSSCRRC